MKKLTFTALFISISMFLFSQNLPLKILAIGDSNGEFDFGWVTQLQKIRYVDKIVNTSISGNTIGFDNLGRKELNTLKNIDSFIKDANEKLNGIDAIIIMLGTNDCKAIFADSLKFVPKNMEKLLSKIKSHAVYKTFTPEIFIVSPPPFGPPEMLIEKYLGGAERIEFLQAEFREIAETENCHFIDSYSEIKDVFTNIITDGIHLTEEGQIKLAGIIDSELDKKLVK